MLLTCTFNLSTTLVCGQYLWENFLWSGRTLRKDRLQTDDQINCSGVVAYGMRNSF